MTSREMTSGFKFLSCGDLHMAVVHLPSKFGANSSIQSGVIDIFSKLEDGAAAILDLQVVHLAHSGMMIVWCLSSVPNLNHISVIVTEIDALMLQTLI